ncbi:cytochrome P450 [Phascolomyces articulosus]|uniref:Cytochrome P450 n=1 Tax=Phascolomyces articulosus TaxID=60185 RepID=A0AAD5K4R9_9FUNG|nr:cytochrome P450 [Phascolomyces articulosus]
MAINQSLIREQLYSYKYYIGIAAAVALVVQRIHRSIFQPPKNLKHIPAVPYSEQFLSMSRKECLNERTRRLIFPILSKANGVYLNRSAIKWTVYVANPILAKAVVFRPEFANKATETMEILGGDESFEAFVGLDNVATVNDPQWKKQRKIMNPAFHRSMPVGLFGNLMQKVIQIIDETQSKGEEVVIIRLSQRLTLEALGRAAFGFEFGALDDENSIWVKTYNQFIASFTDVAIFFPRISKVLRWFSQKRREQFQSGFKLAELLDQIADKKKQALLEKKKLDEDIPDSEKDLLTLMLEAEMREDGVCMSREELRHNMGIFFLAGHDTTSNALSFALYSLAVNKDIQAKAREEVFAVLGDEPKDVLPTVDDCRKFSYIDMIIKEGLRLNPPANDLLPRVPVADTHLGDIMIPKETLVSVDIHALHHNPEIWQDAEKFIPERFAEGGEHSKHEGVTFMPFASGSRICLGMNFSMMEQRVALSMLLRKYEWELPADSIHHDGLIVNEMFNIVPPSLKIKFTKRY